MKKITIALTAHVDAGKTTLAEAILHVCGAVREPGRVDRGNTALDTAAEERARGITVFAGEATVTAGSTELNLLDTPGHVDFSPEAERVLAAADAAVLVISGHHGPEPHTFSLWELLARMEKPVIVFVSKMDTGRREAGEILAELKKELSEACLPADELTGPGEEAALLDEALLERYLAGETLTAEDGLALIRQRKAFPVLFGSGLAETGVRELLDLLERLAPERAAEEAQPFSALVYKISYDEKGVRLTHLRCLGGVLRPRDEFPHAEEEPAEKVGQIRRYTGRRFTQEECLSAGSIACVTGLSGTAAGDRPGLESPAGQPFFEPVMRFTLELPEGLAPETAMPSLRKLGEEDPSLRLRFEPETGTVCADLMGPVQGEILTALIRAR